MEVCAPNLGSTALELVELFERVTGEPFTETPGVPLLSRVRCLTSKMRHLVRSGAGQPPVMAGLRRGHHQNVCWSRLPRVVVDVAAWKARVEAAERSDAPLRGQRSQMAEADAELAAWLAGHAYLAPAELAVGEPSVALLILWEVDHNCCFPTQAAEDDLSGRLTGFTRRLQRRVAGDAALSQWLTCGYTWRAPAAGLPLQHCMRWTVRVRQPGPAEPQGWWQEFTRRWRAYLATQQHAAPALPPAPPPVDEASSSSRLPASAVPTQSEDRDQAHLPEGPEAAACGRRRQRSPEVQQVAKRRRAGPPRVAAKPAPTPEERQRSRPQDTPAEAPPRKRQRQLTSWLTPRPAPEEPTEEDRPQCRQAPHGRAALGPPT